MNLLRTTPSTMQYAALIGFALLPLTSLTAANDVPAKPLAAKGALIVSDGFDGTKLGPAWRVLTETFTVGDGSLKGVQTFWGSPAKDGKPARPAHGAVLLLEVGRKDMVIEFKFRFDGATSINAVCDDMAYKESHGSHICRVALSPTRIRLGDDKESLKHEIVEMNRDPARKAEAAKLVEGRIRDFPCKLEPQRWYRLSIEIVGDEMRAVLDDKPIGYLKSSGIGHPNKSRFHFTVSGGAAEFDDFKLWSVAQH